MNTMRRGLCLVILCMFILSTVPIQAEESTSPSVMIATHWLPSDGAANDHAYLLTFSDNGSYGMDISMLHQRNQVALETDHQIEWGHENGLRTAMLTFNTSLQWGDTIDLGVDITSHNTMPITVSTERSMVVGVWNQPMDDHEVLLSTTWSMDQNYTTEEGEQRFSLVFDGQGWQQRTGDVLNSWELGNGTFQTLESTEDGQTDLDLVFTQLWKNETIVGGVLTSQIFDARGFGSLDTTVIDGETVTVIHADVSQAHLNRSLIEGVIEESLLLEATGDLNVTEDVDNSSLNIDGELSVFYFQYHDVDGERVLQHTQFEAMADFVLIDDGTRLDVSLDGFTSLEHWEDGVRVQHHEELYGTGTFGFEDQDENSSVTVNGSILDLHTKIVNGTTLIDDLHVDGTLSGDVQGTFGVLRGIEETGPQANATEEVFLVNVIHQESWFNITGINGGNFFDGAGLGATHNETWDYQVVNSDWDNRTVRLVWRETGADASEGDERPERSPIQQNASAPEAEDGLGDLTVGRETGLMPIPMAQDDRMRLDGQDGLTLTITAGTSRIDTRDNHNLSVIEWSGTYGGSGESGQASGTIVSVGPLQGLLSSTTRSLDIPFGESNQTVTVVESQYLERVLSPAIVSEDDNSPPVIGELRLQEGLVLGEGGSIAHLEVIVQDSEWNLETVEVDLSPIGGDVVSLNDRGLEGDLSIGDDVYTTAIIVQGLELGEVVVNVTASDGFGASSSASGSILVVNQAPRITSLELVPSSLERGQSIVLNVEAYDGHGVESVNLDLREFGGTVIELNKSGNVWATMAPMPLGMTPGEQNLLLALTDQAGASASYRTWRQSSGAVGHAFFGPHYVNGGSESPIEVTILNDRPTINTEPFSIVKGELELVPYSVHVSDPDGIERVQINMGVYSPVGVTSWVLMHDDGFNGGDEVAGDGNYTALLSVRAGTPLGFHEVSLRAFDTYGEVNLGDAVIELSEADAPVDDVQGLSGAVLVVLGVGVLLAAGLVIALLMRSNDGEDGKNDRFGMQ